MKQLTLYLILISLININTVFAQTTTLPVPLNSGAFGSFVTVLPNGNYVVNDPNYSEGGQTNIGAIYLYNGSTNTIISVLKGSTAGDQIGGSSGYRPGVTVLTNGNFVILSPYWHNGTIYGAGAATWGSATTGVSGIVSASNSLVGDHIPTAFTADLVGEICTPLTNGNYVITSRNWNNARGAATWGNGTTGTSGIVSSSNSIVGSTGYASGAPGDFVARNGSYLGYTGVVALSNGNYVVSSEYWHNGAISAAGAVTWGNGSTGTSGVVSGSNSLVGSHTGDHVGGYTIALTNGNYVTNTYEWDNTAAVDAGAVTWGNGTTGTVGIVGNANSITGVSANDNVGGAFGVFALKNGNYVVTSPSYNNGVLADAGAVTWGNGATGTAGAVFNFNSLVGTVAGDRIGSTSQANYYKGAITPLSNGNYVISSSLWHNGAIAGAGAATWCDGTVPITGNVTTANSLVGSKTSDNVGSIITALSNGNYVVGSQSWDNGATVNVGAATWCNGVTGTVGVVSAINSLVGAKTNDSVSCAGISPLANGNYVVRSSHWDNGALVNAGAATWGDGAVGTMGVVSTANSLVGSHSSDGVSGEFETTNILSYDQNVGVIALTNGNYVVTSVNWNQATGAVTWCNGSGVTTGQVNVSNSLIGSQPNDAVGSLIRRVSNGNYIVHSSVWDNGPLVDAGAFTLGNGSTGVAGFITGCNSVLNTAGAFQAEAVYNSTYNEMIAGSYSGNTVSIFNQGTLTLAGNLDNASLNVYGNTPVPIVTVANCKLIANITANGAAPLASSITAKVWIEATQPVGYVKRHIEITPVTNPSSATGRITLYALQNEFDAFNAVNTIKLPTGPTDMGGIANLYVEKRAGSSGDGTGLPASYFPGTITNINPADVDIVWNSNQARWEVSFDVTGFSGFFIKTNLVLPLKLLSFSATLNNNEVSTTWLTTNEINTQSFEIERSIDCVNFNKVGEVFAYNNSSNNTYNYKDKNVGQLNATILFYRLKEIDNDGKFSYSEIINIKIIKENRVSVYPNPTVDNITVASKSKIALIQLYDMQGKKIKEWLGTKKVLDLNTILQGEYVLNIYFTDGGVSCEKIIKR